MATVETANTGDSQMAMRDESIISLAEVNDETSRICKPHTGSGHLVVNDSNVALQCSNLLSLTPAELHNVISSTEYKKGVVIDPAIVGFPQLLKCMEVIKNGDDRRELFLRATTHESDGLVKKRRGDESKLFALRLTSILSIKEKFKENFYVSSELSPTEVRTLTDYFNDFLGDSPEEGEECDEFFRIHATSNDNGFASSEIYKMSHKSYPTLAWARSVYVKKRMREDYQADLEERAKHVKKLDTVDSSVGVLTVNIPGKVLSTSTTDEGLVILYEKN